MSYRFCIFLIKLQKQPLAVHLKRLHRLMGSLFKVMLLGMEDSPIFFAIFTACQSDLLFPGIIPLHTLNFILPKKWDLISQLRSAIFFFKSGLGFLLKFLRSLFCLLILFLISPGVVHHQLLHSSQHWQASKSFFH